MSRISSQLRDVCPSLYACEDQQLSHATQLIIEARATSDARQRETNLVNAVQLCKGGGINAIIFAIKNISFFYLVFNNNKPRLEK